MQATNWRRYLAALCTAIMFLLGALGVAHGAKSPAGLVDDRSGTFADEQLRHLESGLSNRRYSFRVIILPEAFAGAKPADADTQFRRMADELLRSTQVPKEAVLITVALKEKLVDFRVHSDSSINQEFHQTGGEFGSFSGRFLDSFRGPASQGNIADGILAAVNTIEAVAGQPRPSNPGTTPPSPNPATPPAPIPPRGDSPADDPVDLTGLFRWALLFGGLVASAWLASRVASLTTDYRRRRIAAEAERDSYAGELVQLEQMIRAQADTYTGAETKACITAAMQALEQAFRCHQDGEALRVQAAATVRRLRFTDASAAADHALEQYRRATAAFAEAKSSWHPVQEAIQTWDDADRAATASRSEATNALYHARSATAWPLQHAAELLELVASLHKDALSVRHADPVSGLRLLHEASRQFAAAAADIKRIPERQSLLDAGEQRITEARAAAERARRSIGLRFVEVSPDDSVAEAERCRTGATAQLSDGAFDEADQLLARMRQMADEAVAIVERYMIAVKDCPLKTERLARAVPELQGARAQASSVVSGLQERFAVEDWSDVQSLPARIDTFTVHLRTGLDEARQLTTSSVQRFLHASELLDGWQGEAEELRQSVAALLARPAELESLRLTAEGNRQQAAGRLISVDARVGDHSLVLPAALATQYESIQSSLSRMTEMLSASAIPVRRAANAATEALGSASALLSAVDQLAQQATYAREELARAHRRATAVLDYRQYDGAGHASSLETALVQAEAALLAGDYSGALTHSNLSLGYCDHLESAYQAYVEAERNRQEAEDRRERESNSSSFFSSSSSSDSSSGGGGSFDSGSSGGGGSSDSGSSGGGGSWGE